MLHAACAEERARDVRVVASHSPLSRYPGVQGEGSVVSAGARAGGEWLRLWGSLPGGRHSLAVSAIAGSAAGSP